MSVFLSTLSLRRATVTVLGIQHRVGISIHALLAESDPSVLHRSAPLQQFLSTLSLRRATTIRIHICQYFFNFYPRSPCGERHGHEQAPYRVADFYPRSPCGERQSDYLYLGQQNPISIHALLAESDLAGPSGPAFLYNFYPRSPCGERLRLMF